MHCATVRKNSVVSIYVITMKTTSLFQVMTVNRHFF